MDRLLTLQSETQTFINAQFANLGFDLVLQGCAVTNNGNGTVNIAPGIILVGGNAVRFAGANNISADGSMAFVLAAPVTSYPSIFGDGSTKNIYSEIFATIAAQDPTNYSQIKIGLTLYNLQQYVKDQINASETKGTIKEVYDLDGLFLTNFNSDGAGVTPPWIGWQLDNGNAGTPGSAGKVLVGAGVYTDPVSGLETTYVSGDTGGEINHTLTVDEMPSHTHTTAQIFDTGGGSGPHPITTTAISRTNAGLTINPTGGGLAHNNMQPYGVAYRVVKVV